MYNHPIYGETLRNTEYNFLRDNKYLGDNVLLLALGGSRAYGTNLPESDIDIRGFAINPINQVVGVNKDFEQVVDTATDTTIYSLQKMTNLLLSCNPNTIEILGCRPEDYLYIHELGQLVLDNKENFLSKKAIDTFGGYATAQYNRLQHALLNNGHNNDIKLNVLMHSLQCALDAFNVKHKHKKSPIRLKILGVNKYIKVVQEELQIKEHELQELYSTNVRLTMENPKLSLEEKMNKITSLTALLNNDIDALRVLYNEKLEHPEDEIDDRIVLKGKFKNYPAGEIQILLREFHRIKSEYGKVNKRNAKKDAIHMAKHMTHLIRLYKMGTKLNESLEIHTYWDGDDHDELMYIRLGNFMTGDGMRVRPEFFEYLKEVQDRYDYSVKHTLLPDKPNIEAINQMLFKIYTNKYFNAA